MNNKIKTTDTPALKSLLLEQSQFDLPRLFQVDFSKARASKYDKDNNQTNAVQKYTLDGVDANLFKAVQGAGGNVSDLSSTRIEVTGGFRDIESLVDSDMSVAVELLNPRVTLLWVDGSDGRAGYKAFKIVADGIKLPADRVEKKETK
ncbi:hypothetical protein RyT2_28690 [Pseudolactococcus yaeyamensis]